MPENFRSHRIALTGEHELDPFELAVEAAAEKHGVDPAILRSMVHVESSGRPDAVSTRGARGLMQLMPTTAKALGVSDPHDVGQALEGGARYLRQLTDRFGGDVEMALAAYNAGPTRVAREGKVPQIAETLGYVKKVQRGAEQRRALAGGGN